MIVSPPVPTPVAPVQEGDNAEPEWALALNVTHANGNSDGTTAFGLHAEAALAYDRFDQPEPPAPPTPGAVRAYASRPEWGGTFREYDREAQPAFELGEERRWPLIVESPDGVVTITWSLDTSGELASGLTFEVVDERTSRRWAVDDGETYTFESDGRARRLTVIATASTSVSSEDTPASAFAVRGVSPNPFARSTALRLDVPEPVVVTLVVYDTVGREVLRTEQAVAAGVDVRLPVALDHQQASGIYFYRLTAVGSQAYTATGQMSLVR
ncbi:MAG: hypothetical protein Rubg2KO_22970 [Rubricoccaceae bacterium]